MPHAKVIRGFRPRAHWVNGSEFGRLVREEHVVCEHETTVYCCTFYDSVCEIIVKMNYQYYTLMSHFSTFHAPCVAEPGLFLQIIKL